MKMKNNGGFTLIELLVVITIIAILASFAVPVFNKVVSSAQQTKQVNNVKQITLACQLFATDNNGVFPNGQYDAALGKITSAVPAGTAEECFTDLIESGKLEVEKVFWSAQQATQCAPGTPDENGTLEGEENCWDYIGGLNNSSKATLPLAFEASDGGAGVAWTEVGGHPWSNQVIVGYVDGSANKESMNESGELKVERDGATVDLCAPTPGSAGWPANAALAKATPAA